MLARADTFHYRLERIVRRIFLHPAEGVFHTQGMMMFTAGLLGIGLLMERQEILSGHKVEANTGLDAALIAVWLCWSMWEGRRMIRAGRFSALDRQSWIVFSVITTVLGVLSIVSELRPVVILNDGYLLECGARDRISDRRVSSDSCPDRRWNRAVRFSGGRQLLSAARVSMSCGRYARRHGDTRPDISGPASDLSAGVSLEVRRGDRTK